MASSHSFDGSDSPNNIPEGEALGNNINDDSEASSSHPFSHSPPPTQQQSTVNDVSINNNVSNNNTQYQQLVNSLPNLSVIDLLEKDDSQSNHIFMKIKEDPENETFKTFFMRDSNITEMVTILTTDYTMEQHQNTEFFEKLNKAQTVFDKHQNNQSDVENEFFEIFGESTPEDKISELKKQSNKEFERRKYMWPLIIYDIFSADFGQNVLFPKMIKNHFVCLFSFFFFFKKI